MKYMSTVLFLLLLFLTTQSSQAQSGDGYTITRSTIDGGGLTQATGGEYTLSGTIGQPDAGLATGGGYRLQGGFWHMPSDGIPTAVQLSDGGTLLPPRRIVGILWLVLVCFTGIVLRHANESVNQPHMPTHPNSNSL